MSRTNIPGNLEARGFEFQALQSLLRLSVPWGQALECVGCVMAKAIMPRLQESPRPSADSRKFWGMTRGHVPTVVQMNCL